MSISCNYGIFNKKVTPFIAAETRTFFRKHTCLLKVNNVPSHNEYVIAKLFSKVFQIKHAVRSFKTQPENH